MHAERAHCEIQSKQLWKLWGNENHLNLLRIIENTGKNIEYVILNGKLLTMFLLSSQMIHGCLLSPYLLRIVWEVTDWEIKHGMGKKRHADLKVRNKMWFLENPKECESIGIECITLAQLPI